MLLDKRPSLNVFRSWVIILSLFLSFAVSAAVPSIPSLSVPSSDSDGRYTVSWGSVSNITRYELVGEQSGTLYSGTRRSSSRSKSNGTYYYKVRACNSSGCSAYSGKRGTTVNIPPPVPSVPSLSVPSSGNDGSYSISWGSSSGASRYELQGELSGVLYSGSGRSISRYKPNGTYYYKVKACNSSGCSAFSGKKGIVVNIPLPIPSVPATPTISKFGGNDIKLSWNAISGAAHYYREVSINGAGWQNRTQYTSTSVTFYNQQVRSYRYRVQACNADNICSSYSAASATVAVLAIPVTPSTPTARKVGGNDIKLSWNAISGAAHYYREVSINGAGWKNRTQYTSTSVTFYNQQVRSYRYRVQACNADNICSSYSAASATVTVLAVPATPNTPVVSKTGGNDITANWNSVANAAHYYREVSVNGSTWKNRNKYTGTRATMGDQSAGSFSYRVQACNSDGICSAYSTGSVAITVFPIPAVPAAPTATVAATGDDITVSWSAIAGATHYYREVSLNGAAWQNRTKYTSTSVSLYNQQVRSYRYRVQACNVDDICSAYSSASVAVAVLAVPATPNAPTASKTGGNDITASWNSVVNAAHYYREVSVNGSTWRNRNKYTGTSATMGDQSAGSFSYRVQACNSVGICSAYSAGSTAITVLPVPAIPTAPTAIVAATGDDITVTWSAIAGATHYYREVSLDDAAWQNRTKYTSSSVSFYNQQVRNSYRYRVQACNADDICSGYSSASTAIAVLAVPVTPSTPTASKADGNDITLSWNSVANAAHYYREVSLDGAAWQDRNKYTSTSVVFYEQQVHSYRYRVQACNSKDICSSYSAASATVTVLAIPVTPNTPTVSKVGGNDITANWNSVANAAHYYRQVSVNGTLWKNRNKYTDTSATMGDQSAGSFSYRVQACNSDGICSAYSTGSVAITVFPIPAAPAAPTATVAATGDDITVSWSAIAGATHYYREVSLNGAAWQNRTKYTSTSVSFYNQQVRSYRYRVQACNIDDICSAYSPASNTITLQAAPAMAVVQFEWIPATVAIGENIAFHWNITNADECYLASDSQTGREASGKTQNYVYNEPVVHLTQWYCKDVYGNRLPADENQFLEATRTITADDNSSSTPINLATTTTPTLATVPPENTASTAIGTLPGAFKVDESGAATYSVPLALPQGIAGVTPSLALSYSSAGGNGLLGVGWNLSGLSSISRCRQTTEQDGNIKALNLGDDDRFCLDGQKLIVTSGTYGANGAQYRTEIASQRRITSYGSTNGPDHFTVEAADGSISYYGNTTDSALKNGAVALSWMMNKIQDNLGNAVNFNYDQSNHGSNELLINTISYSGHTVSFKYNTAAARTDTSKGYLHGLVVERTARLDGVEVTHQGGASQRYRLDYQKAAISELTQLTGIQHCAGAEATQVCQTKTNFDWLPLTNNVWFVDPHTVEDAIAGVVPADIDGNGVTDLVYMTTRDSKNYTIKVKYNQRSQTNSFDSAENIHAFYSDKSVTLRAVDVDSDGKVELVFNRGDNWYYFDFNNSITETISYNHGHGEPDVRDIETRVFSLGGLTKSQVGLAKNLLFFDTDGDALTDLVYRGSLSASYSGNTINIVKGLGQNSEGQMQWATAKTAALVDFPVRNVEVPIDYYHRTESLAIAAGSGVYDFNNDGIADLLLSSADYFESEETDCNDQECAGYDYCNEYPERCDPAHVYRESYLVAFVFVDGQYQFFGYAAESNTDSLRTDNSHTVADINADGYSDIFYSGGGWKIKYGTGLGFSDPVDVSIGEGEYTYISRPVISDMNGDGQADIVFFYNTDKTWYVSYQNHGVFSAKQRLVGPFSNYDRIQDSTFLAGFAGNGLLDFAIIDGSEKQIKLYINRDNNFAPSNLIGTIRNGFGNETTINYQRLNNPEVYTKGQNAETLDYGSGSPVFDIVTPGYVVRSAESDAPGYVNGQYDEHNTVSVEYHYQGMRVQSGGRGMLGFEKLTSYDKQSGVTTQTVYHQDYPFAGMPKATISYLGLPQADAIDSDGSTIIAANQRLKYAKNSYGLHRLQQNNVDFPYLLSSTENNYALNDSGTASNQMSSVVTTNSYEIQSDNHANLKTATVTTKNANGSTAGKVTTTNTYNGDNVEHWWLGRVSETTVEHSRADAFPARNIPRVSQFEYYDNSTNFGGMLKQETVAPGLPNQLKTLHCYDAFGNENQQISHANLGSIDCQSVNPLTDNDLSNTSKVFRRKVTSFDAQGRYMTQQGNDKFTSLTINSRNNQGQPTLSTNINGVKTRIGYDSFGSQYFSANSMGQSGQVTRSYSNPGPAIGETYKFTQTTTAAGSGTTIQYFDVMGREVASAKQGFADNSWIIQQIRYDGFGRAIKQSMPHYAGATVYWNDSTYDKFGRPQSSVTADDSSTSILYGTLSTQTGITFNTPTAGVQSQNKIEVNSTLGDLLSVGNKSGTIYYQYNATGNLTKVTGVDGVIITTSYDDWGNKTSMDDPNKGHWEYRYNALGEQISQTSANGFVTTYYRDSLGRTIERNVSGPGVNDSTNYDFGNSHLLQSVGGNGQFKAYGYDALGRTTVVKTTLDGSIYSQQTVFDQYGRVFQQFDADATSLNGCKTGNAISGACWGIQHSYNARGYLISQKEARNGAASDAKEYYRITAMDALGNATGFSQNDSKITSNKTYNPANGQLNRITASKGSVNIQDNEYSFDGLGNLYSRTRHTLKNGTIGQSEDFKYDELNRLTHINNVLEASYFANGNINWKRHVGNYCYNAAKPHAVSGIGSSGCTTQSYQYDDNGNMTSGRDRTIVYAHFDKPTRITSSNGDQTTFAYGTNRSRYKRITTEAVEGTNVTTTTYYIGNIEVESKSNSTVAVIRRNLPGAVELLRDNGSSDISFLHQDHLGSIDTITDKDGNIQQKLYFNAWGKKTIIASNNMLDSLQDYTTLSLSQVLNITKRGFTGHESVDHADIIHMNGRIYDPTLGRFLQADPLIQAPKNSQSYNRYAYVINNPLSLTDPSGFSFFSKLWKKVRPFIGVIVAVVGAYLCGQPCAQIGWQIAAVGAASGAAQAAVNGGNIFNGALMGAFTAGVGQYGTAYAAFAGGVASKIQGGNFGHGFWAAGLSSGIGGGSGKGWAKVISAAIVGGTISKLTGGKFKNGAYSAAFAAALRADWSDDLSNKKTTGALGDGKFSLDFVLKAAKQTKLALEGLIADLQAGKGNPNYERVRQLYGFSDNDAFAGTADFLIGKSNEAIKMIDALVSDKAFFYSSASHGDASVPGKIGFGFSFFKGHQVIDTFAHELGHHIGFVHGNVGMQTANDYLVGQRFKAYSSYPRNHAAENSLRNNAYNFGQAVGNGQ